MKLRQEHIDLILGLAFHASKTSEYLVRSMEYVIPHQGYADLKDQFMLRNNLLIAPILENGKKGHVTQFPKIEWRGTNQQIL